MRRLSSSLLLVLAASWVLGAEFEPRRQNGLSAHLMPKVVAADDESGQTKWGYTLSLPGEQTKPALERKVVQSAQALVEFINQQSITVRSNGIWVITTHPDAYSATEKADLEELKRLCKKEAIPLFICRGAELPNGWKRFSATRLNLLQENRA